MAGWDDTLAAIRDRAVDFAEPTSTPQRGNFLLDAIRERGVGTPEIVIPRGRFTEPPLPEVPDEELDAPELYAKAQEHAHLTPHDQFAKDADFTVSEKQKKYFDLQGVQTPEEMFDGFGFKPIGIDKWDPETLLKYSETLPMTPALEGVLTEDATPEERKAYAEANFGPRYNPTVRDPLKSNLADAIAMPDQAARMGEEKSQSYREVYGYGDGLADYPMVDSQMIMHHVNDSVTGRPGLEYYRKVESAAAELKKNPTNLNQIKLRQALESWRGRQQQINADVRAAKARFEQDPSRPLQEHVNDVVMEQYREDNPLQGTDPLENQEYSDLDAGIRGAMSTPVAHTAGQVISGALDAWGGLVAAAVGGRQASRQFARGAQMRSAMRDRRIDQESSMPLLSKIKRAAAESFGAQIPVYSAAAVGGPAWSVYAGIGFQAGAMGINDARNQNMGWGAALTKGVLDGLVEGGTEWAGGKIAKAAGLEVAEDAMRKASRSFSTPKGKWGASKAEQLLKVVIGEPTTEALEEGAAYMANSYTDQLTGYDKNAVENMNVEDLMFNMAVGAMSGGFMASPSAFGIMLSKDAQLSEKYKQQLRDWAKQTNQDADKLIRDKEQQLREMIRIPQELQDGLRSGPQFAFNQRQNKDVNQVSKMRYSQLIPEAKRKLRAMATRVNAPDVADIEMGPFLRAAQAWRQGRAAGGDGLSLTGIPTVTDRPGESPPTAEQVNPTERLGDYWSRMKDEFTGERRTPQEMAFDELVASDMHRKRQNANTWGQWFDLDDPYRSEEHHNAGLLAANYGLSLDEFESTVIARSPSTIPEWQETLQVLKDMAKYKQQEAEGRLLAATRAEESLEQLEGRREELTSQLISGPQGFRKADAAKMSVQEIAYHLRQGTRAHEWRRSKKAGRNFADPIRVPQAVDPERGAEPDTTSVDVERQLRSRGYPLAMIQAMSPEEAADALEEGTTPQQWREANPDRVGEQSPTRRIGRPQGQSGALTPEREPVTGETDQEINDDQGSILDLRPPVSLGTGMQAGRWRDQAQWLRNALGRRPSSADTPSAAANWIESSFGLDNVDALLRDGQTLESLIAEQFPAWFRDPISEIGEGGGVSDAVAAGIEDELDQQIYQQTLDLLRRRAAAEEAGETFVEEDPEDDIDGEGFGTDGDTDPDMPPDDYTPGWDNQGEPEATEDEGTAPARQPYVFFSGLQSDPADFEKAYAEQRDVGISLARKPSKTILDKVVRHLRAGLHVFVDSGAFSNNVKDFTPVLEMYREIADELTPAERQRLFVMAPDVVGDQGATLELIQANSGELNDLLAENVQVIFAYQKPMDAAENVEFGEFYSLLTNAIDFYTAGENVVIGIPFNAAAWSADEVESFARGWEDNRQRLLSFESGEGEAFPGGRRIGNSGLGETLRLHLLGGGEIKTRDMYDRLSQVSPGISVTGDSSTWSRNKSRRVGRAPEAETAAPEATAAPEPAATQPAVALTPDSLDANLYAIDRSVRPMKDDQAGVGFVVDASVNPTAESVALALGVPSSMVRRLWESDSDRVRKEDRPIHRPVPNAVGGVVAFAVTGDKKQVQEIKDRFSGRKRKKSTPKGAPTEAEIRQREQALLGTPSPPKRVGKAPAKAAEPQPTAKPVKLHGRPYGISVTKRKGNNGVTFLMQSHPSNTIENIAAALGVDPGRVMQISSAYTSSYHGKVEDIPLNPTEETIKLGMTGTSSEVDAWQDALMGGLAQSPQQSQSAATTPNPQDEGKPWYADVGFSGKPLSSLIEKLKAFTGSTVKEYGIAKPYEGLTVEDPKNPGTRIPYQPGANWTDVYGLVYDMIQKGLMVWYETKPKSWDQISEANRRKIDITRKILAEAGYRLGGLKFNEHADTITADIIKDDSLVKAPAEETDQQIIDKTLDILRDREKRVGKKPKESEGTKKAKEKAKEKGDAFKDALEEMKKALRDAGEIATMGGGNPRVFKAAFKVVDAAFQKGIADLNVILQMMRDWLNESGLEDSYPVFERYIRLQHKGYLKFLEEQEAKKQKEAQERSAGKPAGKPTAKPATKTPPGQPQAARPGAKKPSKPKVSDKKEAEVVEEDAGPSADELSSLKDFKDPEIDDESAKVLKQARVEVVSGSVNGVPAWSVTKQRRTVNGHNVHQLLEKLGGEWDGRTKSFIFRHADPRRVIARELSVVRPADPGDGEGTGGGQATERGRDEHVARIDARRRERGRIADQRPARANAIGLVSSATRALIQRGSKFGISDEVLTGQMEDIGLIKNAFQKARKAFSLSAAAGMGKTFVLAGAIRELRDAGAKKFIYVTENRNLIKQVKRDMEPYLGKKPKDVEFVTYAGIRNGRFSAKGAVLIFDEGHNIKNKMSQQGNVGMRLAGEADFTILSSATPFENPLQAQYLGQTTVFDEVEAEIPRIVNGKEKPIKVKGFPAWAWMHGAEIRFHDGTPPTLTWPEKKLWNDEDFDLGPAMLDANEWFRRQGIYSNRPPKFDPGMVISRNVEAPADPEFAEYQSKVIAAYRFAAENAEDGNAAKQILTKMLPNAQKRLLEIAKVAVAIRRARAEVDAGNQVAVFVENKSPMTVGHFALSSTYREHYKIGGEAAERRYGWNEIQVMMDKWKQEKAAREMMGDKSKFPAPFSGGVVAVARQLFNENLVDTLPSTPSRFKDEFGDQVVEYTGNVTDAVAKKNHELFMNNKAKVILATFDKGGTGLSYHDTTGKMPSRIQIVVNLPWTATKSDQVAGRIARQGIKKPVTIEWLFSPNVLFEKALATRVGNRMKGLSATVKGIDDENAQAVIKQQMDNHEDNGIDFIPDQQYVEPDPPPELQESTPPQHSSSTVPAVMVSGETVETKAAPKAPPKRVGGKNKKRDAVQIEESTGRLPLIDDKDMVIGRDTSIDNPIGGSLPAKYVLVRGKRTIASHDYWVGPVGASANPLYPSMGGSQGSLQPRDGYLPSSATDSRSENWEKVVQYSNNPNYSMLINEVEGSGTGPGIMTPEGVMLGGNGRNMTKQSIWADGRWQDYEDYLRPRLAQFGFTEADLDSLKQDPNDPVFLERMVNVDYASKEAGDIASWTNEDKPQEETPLATANSLKRLLPMDAVADMELDADTSIAKLLPTPAGQHLMKRFISAIPEAIVPRYFDVPKKGDIVATAAGKELMQNVLTLQFFPRDMVRMMGDEQKSLRNALDAAITQLLLLDSKYTQHGFKQSILDAVNYMLLHPEDKTIAEAESRMFDEDMFGRVVEDPLTPEAMMWLEFLLRDGRKSKVLRQSAKALVKALDDAVDPGNMFADGELDVPSIVADVLKVQLREDAVFEADWQVDGYMDMTARSQRATQIRNNKREANRRAQAQASVYGQGSSQVTNPFQQNVETVKEIMKAFGPDGAATKMAEILREENARMGQKIVQAQARIEQLGRGDSPTSIVKAGFINALAAVGMASDKMKSQRDAVLTIRERLSKMDKNQVTDFIHAIERNKIDEELSDPWQRKVAKIFRELMDDGADMVEQLGDGHMTGFIKHYFPHMWKPRQDRNPGSMIDMILPVGKSPIKGSQSFRKERYIGLFKDGVEKYGLEPRTWNPMDMILMRYTDMNRYIFGVKVFERIREAGMLKFIPESMKSPPQGMKFMNDISFISFGPPTEKVAEQYDEGMVEPLLAWMKKMGIKAERVFTIPELQGSWGYASKGDKSVVTKFGSLDAALAHEVGHHLDYNFKLAEWMGYTEGIPAKMSIKERQRRSGQIKRELTDLAHHRLEGTASPGARNVLSRNEKMAIIFEAYAYARDTMRDIAPNVLARFEEFLDGNPNLKELKNVQPTLKRGKAYGDMPIYGMRIMGKFAAPSSAATVFNNFVSSGIFYNRSADWKMQGISMVAREMRQVAVAANQFQLFSGFQALQTGLSAMASSGGQGMRMGLEGVRMGDKELMAHGAAEFMAAMPLVNFVTAFRMLAEGRQIANVMETIPLDQIPDPKMRAMIEEFLTSGTVSKVHKYMLIDARQRRITASGRRRKLLEEGRTVEAASLVPKIAALRFMSLFEVGMAPVLAYLVPYLKLGMMARMYRDELMLQEKKGGGQINMANFRKRMIEISNAADDRLGQLNYDNLMVHRAVLDASMLMLRAPGWNYGFLRGYIAGPVIDTYKQARRLFRKQGDLEDDAVLSYRMAEAMATFLFMGIYGGLLNYLNAGEWPKELLDYWFPRTGHTRPDGSAERWNLPSYMKDYFAWVMDPYDTAKNKLSPFWQIARTPWEAMQGDNQDYFGNQIARWEEGRLVAYGDILGEVLQQLVPFSLQNYWEMRKDDVGMLQSAVVSGLGIGVAPAKIGRTPALKLLKDIQADQARRGASQARTVQEAKAAEMRRELVDRMRDGKGYEDIDYRQYFDQADIDRMKKQAEKDPFAYLYDRLDATDAMRVYNLANPEERDKVAHMLVRKFLTKFGASEADRANVELIRAYIDSKWDDIGPRLNDRAGDVFVEAARVAYQDLKHPRMPSEPEELQRYSERVRDYRIWQASVRAWLDSKQGDPAVWSDTVREIYDFRIE